MARIKVSRTIRRPPEAVFEFVSDNRNDPQWAPLVRNMEQIKGDGPGLGARYAFDQWIGPNKTRRMEIEVTQFEAPHRIAWRMQNALMDYESQIVIEPASGGCRVQQTNTETWLFAGPLLKLAMPAMIRFYLKKQLKVLAKHLETK